MLPGIAALHEEPDIAAGKEGGARSMMQESFGDRLRAFAAEFNKHLDRLLTPAERVTERLKAAVRYAALGPGKRIRPYLVVTGAKLVGHVSDDAWTAAAALECVHAFSLVHDDLPAMDDDDLRRGRATCHRQFDEATAILAGDALLALAFELIVRDVRDRDVACQMVAVLSRATGWAGMIGGQALDLQSENEPASRELVESIHEQKTVALFRAACELGALAGRGSPEEQVSLCQYGQWVGRTFQIADDLLDQTASESETGKRTRKDHAAGKQTYPRCVGEEQARVAAEQAAQRAISALDRFGPAADDLRALATFAWRRAR